MKLILLFTIMICCVTPTLQASPAGFWSMLRGETSHKVASNISTLDELKVILKFASKFTVVLFRAGSDSDNKDIDSYFYIRCAGNGLKYEIINTDVNTEAAEEYGILDQAPAIKGLDRTGKVLFSVNGGTKKDVDTAMGQTFRYK